MAEVIVYYPERERGVRDPGYIEGSIVGKLVRCKDCKHWKQEQPENCGYCEEHNESHTGVWFCADGEMK